MNTWPSRPIARVIAIRADSICLLVIQLEVCACNPNSPNETLFPFVAVLS